MTNGESVQIGAICGFFGLRPPQPGAAGLHFAPFCVLCGYEKAVGLGLMIYDLRLMIWVEAYGLRPMA